jgi:allophanate hydrolase
MSGFDALDPYSRRAPATLPSGVAASFTTIGVPAGPIDLDPSYRSAFERSLDMARDLGLRVIPMDIAAFLEVAQLLYSGPWVAERYAAFGHLLDGDGADPTVRQVVLAGRDMTAVAAIEAFEKLATLRRRSEACWEDIDALLLPVTPTHPTLAAVAADPIGVNSRLGTFTNFVNLLDLCALAVPGVDTAEGLPFGVQFIAPAFADQPLLDLAARWTGEPLPVATPKPGMAEVVLVGAHMSGLPLNHLVSGRGGRLLRRARTADGYDLVRVPGPGVPRPALIAGAGPEAGFAVEVWEIPLQTLGNLASELSSPLRLGQLRLDDGTSALGYVGDDTALSQADSLNGYDGWRAYLRDNSP